MGSNVINEVVGQGHATGTGTKGTPREHGDGELVHQADSGAAALPAQRMRAARIPALRYVPR